MAEHELPSFRQQVRLLRATNHMHSNWYRERYRDVAELGMNPAEHYLRIGANLGRDPGKNFDSRFYREAYPDVAENGMNPLLAGPDSGPRCLSARTG